MGGQGIVLLGTILGTAAVVHERKFATQAPSYGTETRGSPAKSQIVISSEKIGYPEIRKASILIAMTQAALSCHAEMLNKQATVIVDSDLVKTIPSTLGHVWKVPATRLSEEKLGSRNYANMVMFGAMVKVRGLVSRKAAKDAITSTVPEHTVGKNLMAFELGVKAAETTTAS